MIADFRGVYSMVFKKVLAVMLASVAVGAFSGCDSKDTAAPVADSDVTEKNGDVTVGDLGVEFDALQAKLLTETPPAFPEPVASKTALHGRDAPYAELVIEVYEVKAREDSTFVSWDVRSVKGDEDATSFRLSIIGGGIDREERLPFVKRDYARVSTTAARHDHLLLPHEEVVA